PTKPLLAPCICVTFTHMRTTLLLSHLAPLPNLNHLHKHHSSPTHMRGSTMHPFTLHILNIHPLLGIPATPRRVLHTHTPHTPTYNPATAHHPSPSTPRRPCYA
ncbi:hypothetical protein PIB30_102974, partial [Stylosanthes scabra]|nr:hypothetical protein [Stylosanthes scabra]